MRPARLLLPRESRALTNAATHARLPAHVGLYLMLYGLSGLLASGLNMGSSLLVWAYCAIRCSKALHDASFTSTPRSSPLASPIAASLMTSLASLPTSGLMRSPMHFFETTVRTISLVAALVVADPPCAPSCAPAPRADP